MLRTLGFIFSHVVQGREGKKYFESMAVLECILKKKFDCSVDKGLERIREITFMVQEI